MPEKTQPRYVGLVNPVRICENEHYQQQQQIQTQCTDMCHNTTLVRKHFVSEDGLVCGIPAHGRRGGTKMILRSSSTLTILQFYDFVFCANPACWESVTFSKF